MVVTAERSQAAFAGAATLVKGDRVVKIAARGRPLAAGSTAGGSAGGDQMPETPARLIARLFVTVVAGAPGQGVNGQREALGGQALQGAGAGGAAVAERLTVVAGDGQAATGRRVAGCGGG
jgi:hypothetical protein